MTHGEATINPHSSTTVVVNGRSVASCGGYFTNQVDPESLAAENDGNAQFIKSAWNSYLHLAARLGVDPVALAEADVLGELYDALNRIEDGDIDCNCKWYGGVCACGKEVAAKALAKCRQKEPGDA